MPSVGRGLKKNFGTFGCGIATLENLQKLLDFEIAANVSLIEGIIFLKLY